MKAKVGKIEKKPIVVTLTNNGGGDMYLTDLTLGVYQEVDEDGNPIVTGIEQVEKESATKTYQMYQTTNGLIVYGDIASLNVFSADGKKVAGSTDSQFVNTSPLSRACTSCSSRARMEAQSHRSSCADKLQAKEIMNHRMSEKYVNTY